MSADRATVETNDEAKAFFAALTDAQANPSSGTHQLYVEIENTPGATGRDVAGILVRRTELGGLEPIRPD